MKASRLLIAGAVAALLPLAGAFAQSPPPQTDPSTQPAQESQQPQQQQPQQQGATFESLDKDGDGKISKAEAASNANVSQQFSRYDKNGDGFIEKEEVSSSNKATDPSKQ
jgi:Ca2+-binding EF-hand superfamily protein